MTTVDKIRKLIWPAVLLPIPAGEKGPRLKGWQKLTIFAMNANYLERLNHGQNIGVLLGSPSFGLCSIDIDSDDHFKTFLELNSKLRDTLNSRGARGGNIWVRIIGEYPSSCKIRLADQDWGEWRATGNQTVLHGVHPSGRAYENNNKCPLEIAFSDIRWPERLALPWRLTPESNNGFSWSTANRDLTSNDAGRAERFIRRFEQDIRFVPEKGMWLIWESERWQMDFDGGLERLAISLSREMLADASAIVGTNDAAAAARSRACQEALACGDRRNIADYAALAQVDRRILLHARKLDADPWRIGARNAVINLQNGDVCSYGRSDYITHLLGCDVDHEATCPRWNQFMEEIFEEAEVRHYVHKAVGYTLTGNMNEQVFFFLYGTGRNGKSKFIELLEYIFGTYAARAGKGIVAASSRGDYPLREMADIVGARLLVASETEENERLNESVIKDLTGGDSARAEHKYQRAFIFHPACKLWIAGNHKPSIRGTDCGIWRRVRLIPFTRTFEGANEDRMLGDKLKAEAKGILNWAVRGAILWHQEGLIPPAAISSAVADYRAEEDTLADYINECTSEQHASVVTHAEIVRSYQNWANANCIRYPLSSKMLAKRLRERDWRDDFNSKKAKIWRGVALTNAG